MRNPAVAEERCRSYPSLNGTVRITVRPLGRVEPVDGRQLPACRQRESNPRAIQRFMSRPETGFGHVPQPHLTNNVMDQELTSGQSSGRRTRRSAVAQDYLRHE